MLERVSKSARYFAVASYLVGLGGCASDGGVGDLAMLGAIGGSMMPGVDSGTVAALGAVAVGSMVVAPAFSSDTNTAVAPAPVATVAMAAPAVSPGWGDTTLDTGLPQTSLAKWIALESSRKYEGRSCEYLQRAYAQGQEMLAGKSAESQALGRSKVSAISPVLDPKNCPPLDDKGRGRIGMGFGGMDPVKAARLGMPLKGVSVESVVPGGSADKAGLKHADVIVSVDSTPVDDDIEFLVALRKVPVGSTMTFKVWRQSNFINFPLVMGPAP